MRPWRRPPRSDDPRERLLERLRPHVADARVLAAIRAVPRDRFVPEHLARRGVGQRRAADRLRADDLPAARGRAHVRAARAAGDERVLDVGTGSGYHAAVLAQLVGHVWSIERHPELSAQAAEALAAAGVENVTLLVGDGARGHPGGRALRRDQRRRRDGRGPARAAPTSSPRAGGSSGRSTPPTSGSCCCAAGAAGWSARRTSACASCR